MEPENNHLKKHLSFYHFLFFLILGLCPWRWSHLDLHKILPGTGSGTSTGSLPSVGSWSLRQEWIGLDRVGGKMLGCMKLETKKDQHYWKGCFPSRRVINQNLRFHIHWIICTFPLGACHLHVWRFLERLKPPRALSSSPFPVLGTWGTEGFHQAGRGLKRSRTLKTIGMVGRL